MLSEELLELVTERVVNRIQDGNTAILKQIGKSIDEIGKLNSTEARQLVQMLKYGGDYDKIVKKLAEMTNLSVKDVQDIFKEVAKSNYKFAEQFYRYRNVPYIPYEENIALKSQVQAIANITSRRIAEMMNPRVLGFGMIDTKTGAVTFKGLQQAYYDLLDEAVLTVGQGKETFDHAMSRQIKEMGGGGLKVIYESTYINKDGVEVHHNRRLDSAIRMNLKDGLRDLHNETQTLFGEQFGADGKEISVHEAPAPDHELVQGRQLSITEYNKLQSDGVAKTYDGIDIDLYLGNAETFRPISQYNCYHTAFSIVLGVSKAEYTNEELQGIIDANNEGFEIDGKHYTRYQGTQMQRRLETAIREQKDIQIMAREGGQDNTVKEAQEKITQLTQKYKELSSKANLPTRMDRMKVSGYKRVKVTNEPKDINNIKVNSKDDLLNKWNGKYKDDNIVVKHILKAEPQLIDEQITQVDSLLNKYSFIKRDINQDSTLNALTMQVNTGDIMGEKNYARFFGGHYIEFNEKYFKGKDLLVSDVKDRISKKWWQDIDTDKYSIYPVTHEFGHLLEYKMIENIEHANGFKGSLMRGDYMIGDLRIYKEISKKVPNIDEYLSGYGKSTPRFEWFAETFTQMELGKETPVTKALEEYIDEFMGGNYGYFR